MMNDTSKKFIRKGDTMIFMKIFWFLAVLVFILYLVRDKYEKIKRYSDVLVALFFLAVASLIVAIVTKDPLFAQFGVPGEYEWIIGMSMTLFTAWKLYFDPMKQRLISLEKRFEKMDAKFETVQTDIHLIKEKLFTM